MSKSLKVVLLGGTLSSKRLEEPLQLIPRGITGISNGELGMQQVLANTLDSDNTANVYWVEVTISSQSPLEFESTQRHLPPGSFVSEKKITFLTGALSDDFAVAVLDGRNDACNCVKIEMSTVEPALAEAA